MGFSSDSGSSLKGASSGILEYFVGAHSLNILSRLESLSGGPSGGGYNCWQLRPHGNMGMAVPSHHPGHLTWDQGCIWYFGRWEVHRSSPNHSQTRSFNRKSQNTSLLVIDLEHRTSQQIFYLRLNDPEPGYLVVGKLWWFGYSRHP